jgi:hypothetical protein
MGLNHQTMCLWAICMALQLVLLHVIILEQHEDVKIVFSFSQPTNENAYSSHMHIMEL